MGAAVIVNTKSVTAKGNMGLVQAKLTVPEAHATAVTGAVTSELLRFCDQVVLNVRADNPPALAAYRHLGYQVHVNFEERLIHRSESVWSGWAGPIRRLFTRRKES